MKKIIFLMGVVMIYLISCKGNKFSDGPNPTDYSKYQTIPEDSAIKMIDTFPSHKLVRNASANFDRGLLSKLANDSNVKSITFFLAAHIKGKGNDTDLIPTILIRVKMENTSRLMSKIPVYYRPLGICPPPKVDCKVQ